MTVASPTQPTTGFAPTSFDDPAFDAHPGFDFEDNDEDDLRHMQNSIASMNVFHGANPGFDMSGQSNQMNPSFHDFGHGDPFPVGSGAFTPGMSSSIDPTAVWEGMDNSQAGAFGDMRVPAGLPPSFQADIVRSRGGVAEKYGQITPPDNTPSEDGDRKDSASSTQSGKPKKLDKSERARNAANQRHAKSKKARIEKERMDNKDDVLRGSDSEGSVEGKREKYREKNRLAAAKCRAKKKENTEGLEEKYRALSAANSFLKTEMRQLRNELSECRTIALRHDPSAPGCRCARLHAYNQHKANEIAGSFPNISSPSDFGSCMASPVEGPMAHMFGGHQSFAEGPPSNIAFAQVTTQQDMASMTATAPATSSGGQQNFSSFLQSSPGGRAGFS